MGITTQTQHGEGSGLHLLLHMGLTQFDEFTKPTIKDILCMFLHLVWCFNNPIFSPIFYSHGATIRIKRDGKGDSNCAVQGLS